MKVLFPTSCLYMCSNKLFDLLLHMWAWYLAVGVRSCRCRPVSIEPIGVGAGIFLRVQRIFARISPNLPETFLGHCVYEYMTSRKKVFMWFRTRWAPFLPVFSWILPRYLGILRRFQRFSQILPRFLQILPGISGILPGFSPNQKFWGCACTPCIPASYTTDWTNTQKQILENFFLISVYNVLFLFCVSLHTLPMTLQKCIFYVIILYQLNWVVFPSRPFIPRCVKYLLR